MTTWVGRYVGAWFVGVLMFGEIVDAGRAYAGGSPGEQTVVPLADGFEDDVRFTSRCTAQKCASLWIRDNFVAHTGSFSFFGADVPTASDKTLLPLYTLIIPADATAATLTFWHRFDFEHTDPGNFYDGGVLEVSTDDGQSWADLGSHISTGGYNGTIANTGNALAGRAGWVGTMSDFQQVIVDLMTYRGQSFTFRLRMGTDSSNLTTPQGWSVDDVQVSYNAPLASCARSWSTVSPYPIGVVEPAAVGLDGNLYVFGGEASNGATDKAYKYVAASDEWTPIASLPEARRGASAVSDGTFVYIIGGAVGEQLRTTLWRYDPAANNYVTLSPLNTAIAFHGAAFIQSEARGGFIFRIGGTTDGVQTNYTDAIELYSILDDVWGNVLLVHPEALGRLAVLALDGSVYTAGGSSNGGGASLKTYRLDPEARAWDDGPIADLPGRTPASGSFYQRVWLLSAGGTAIGWDRGTNRWRSFDQIPKLVLGATAAATSDAFYLIGGVARMAPVTTVQKYVETDCASPTPTVTPPAATSTAKPPLGATSTATPPPGATSTATAPAGPTSTRPTGSACLGDCGDDGTVGVSELIRGVSIALGLQSLESCPTFDGNRDGMVAVNELIAAVNNALLGCS